MNGMTIDKGQSPLAEAQKDGSAKVGGETRKVVTANRKTDKGKESKVEAERKRIQDKQLFKSTLKKEEGEEEDEWEDLEEDFPHMKLEELLDNLKLGDDDSESEEQKD